MKDPSEASEARQEVAPQTLWGGGGGTLALAVSNIYKN